MSAPLDAAFYCRPAEEVARALLGAHLVSTVDGGRAVGRIVETEAYVGSHDPASHAAERTGRTPRNEVMFGAPGLAYVYRSYGIHWCLNVVTNAVDDPGAVLLRGIEPLEGHGLMRRRRWPDRAAGSDRLIGSGPGRLARALGVTGALNGHSLARPPLLLTRGESVPAACVVVGPRIGITRAADWPLRFHIRDNPHVSR